MITSYHIAEHPATGMLYVTLNTKERWPNYQLNRYPSESGLSITFLEDDDEETETISIDNFNARDYQMLSQQEKDQITVVCLPLKMIREFKAKED